MNDTTLRSLLPSERAGRRTQGTTDQSTLPQSLVRWWRTDLGKLFPWMTRWLGVASMDSARKSHAQPTLVTYDEKTGRWREDSGYCLSRLQFAEHEFTLSRTSCRCGILQSSLTISIKYRWSAFPLSIWYLQCYQILIASPLSHKMPL